MTATAKAYKDLPWHGTSTTNLSLIILGLPKGMKT